ncbi:hypothetical protein YC2023_000237 [Brassica napus]
MIHSTSSSSVSPDSLWYVDVSPMQIVANSALDLQIGAVSVWIRFKSRREDGS